MIRTVVPKLPFIEQQETLDFYVNQLNFTLNADYGNYLILSQDQVELHFFSFPDLRRENSDFMIYLRIDSDIEKYYEDLQNRGVSIHPNGKLETKPWNQKEFSIIDPCGTLLTFGQSI
jgi:uncharacterized glyoxalase superfamily protein PhnB